jgi:hypothetical protein
MLIGNRLQPSHVNSEGKIIGWVTPSHQYKSQPPPGLFTQWGRGQNIDDLKFKQMMATFSDHTGILQFKE